MVAINNYVDDLINMTLSIEAQLPLAATLNLTNSMGEWSPILRQCYQIGGEVSRNWGPYWKKYQNFTLFYQMIKGDVVQNYTDLDTRGSSLWDSITVTKNWTQTSFDSARIIFLIFFQPLVQKTPLKSAREAFL